MLTTHEIITSYPLSRAAQKIASENWIEERLSDGEWVFSTLTFKFETTEKDASKHLKTFQHRLSKKIYKNNYRRKKKLLEMFAVLEGDNIANRVHVHAAIRVANMTPFEFSEQISQNWLFGNVQSRTIIENDGAVGYLLKSRSKTLNSDVLLIV